MSDTEYILDANVFFRSLAPKFEFCFECNTVIQNHKDQRFLVSSQAVREIQRGIDAITELQIVFLRNLDSDEQVVLSRLTDIFSGLNIVRQGRENFTLAFNVLNAYRKEKLTFFELKNLLRSICSKLNEFLLLLETKQLDSADLFYEEILKLLCKISKKRRSSRSDVADAKMVDDLILYAIKNAGGGPSVSLVTLDQNLISLRAQVTDLISSKDTKLEPFFGGGCSRAFDIIHIRCVPL